MFKRGYTYDDVCLVPCFSNLTSRLEPDTTTWLTKDLQVKIPILNAPMDSVIGDNLAEILLELGTIPIFNRKNTLEEYKILYSKWVNRVFVSVGANDLSLVRNVLDLGFDKILLDTANGHTRSMMDLIYKVKKEYAVQVMAGNVASGQAYMDLVNAGADCIRVGIGGGAACTTRIKTAIGVPQFSAVLECAEMSKKFKVPFIADGGINGPREVCLALAAGATTVMVGKLLALTEESAAEKQQIGTNTLKAKYRGQASRDYQVDNYGKVKDGTCVEGVSFWAPVKGPARDVVGELIAGLRSSMTYLGARNIKEYQTKAEFMEVTSTYMRESYPRVD